MSKKSKKSGDFDNAGGVEKTLKGLSGMLGKLTELAELGEQLKHSGEFQGKTAQGNDFKGRFGVSVKTGIVDDAGGVPHPVPFKKASAPNSATKKTAPTLREPPVDVFEEPDHILVVAEIPGIGRDDLTVTLEEDILTFAATVGEKKYRKEVLLPRVCAEENMRVSVKNGVVKIIFEH